MNVAFCALRLSAILKLTLQKFDLGQESYAR